MIAGLVMPKVLGAVEKATDVIHLVHIEERRFFLIQERLTSSPLLSVLRNEVFLELLEAEWKVEELRVLGSASLDSDPFTSFASNVYTKATAHGSDVAPYRSFARFHTKLCCMRRLERCTTRHERGGDVWTATEHLVRAQKSTKKGCATLATIKLKVAFFGN